MSIWTSPRRLLLVPAACASLAVSGCGLLAQTFGAEDVAVGVAQLSVSTAGVVVGQLNANADCGFSSPEVIANAKIVGEPGQFGKIIYEVSDCVMQYPNNSLISEGNCLGEGAQAADGTVTVISATRTLEGTVTGVPESPIIPAGPNAVTIDITADLDRFRVESQGQPNVLTVVAGRLTFRVKPQLAESTDEGAPGVCAAITGNTLLQDVTFGEDTLVHLLTETNGSFEVEVDALSVTAHNGKYFVGGEEFIENRLEGTVAVWGNDPITLDQDLNPSYDEVEFFEGWASCDPEGFGEDPEVRKVKLVNGQPNYTCVSEIPADRLSDGIGRLTVNNFGTIVQLIQADTECGFQSQAVLDEGVATDDGSGVGGITWTVTDCTMSFPKDTVVSTNCAGDDTLVSGALTVSGTFTLEGRLTQNPDNPVIPRQSEAVFIDLTDITFDNFTVRSAARPEYLTQRSGRLVGSIRPLLAVGESTGACSIPTPNVVMDGLAYTDAEVTVVAPQGAFDASVSTSSIRAVNGEFGDEVDVFEGSITVNGEVLTLPDAAEHQGLIAGFELDAHHEGYACTDDLQLPLAFDGCTAVEDRLINGAARLTVNHFGSVASMVQRDESCGFSSPEVVDAVVTTGNLGERGGTATYTVENCVFDFGEPTLVGSLDCNGGGQQELHGKVTVSGTMTLSGWLASPDDKAEPIVPDTWTPAVLDLTMTFDDFTVADPDRAESLTVRNGSLSGVVTPQTGVDTTNDACATPTGNTKLSDLTWSDNAELQVNASGTYVVLPVAGSSLQAVNGVFEGQENHLGGTLSIGNAVYDVPFDEPGLNPDYDAATFEAGWKSCLENFEMPASSESCNFYKVIGEGAARLVIQSMGEAASFINSDAECGFGFGDGLLPQDNVRESVLHPEDANEGDDVTLSFTTDTKIEDYPDGCFLVTDQATPPNENCAGDQTFSSGTMGVKSDRVVGGSYAPVNVPFIGTINNINSNDHNEVDVELREVNFTDWKMWSLSAAGEPGPGELTMHNGTGTGHVFPILAPNFDAPENHQGPTPVAFLKGIAYSGDVTLKSQGKTFVFSIDAMEVDAFNGRWAGDSNWNNDPIYDYGPMSIFSTAGPYENFIDGWIQVDGVNIEMDMQGLVPGFSSSEFEAGYCPCAIEAEEIASCIPQ